MSTKSETKRKPAKEPTPVLKAKDLPAKAKTQVVVKGGDIVWRPNHNETLVSVLNN